MPPERGFSDEEKVMCVQAGERRALQGDRVVRIVSDHRIALPVAGWAGLPLHGHE